MEIWTFTIRNIDIKLINNPKVFLPSSTSFFITGNIIINPGETVCDVGSGSGLISILASILGAKKVLALETDPVAISNAKLNIKLNNLNNIEIYKSNFYSNSNSARFDVIVANLPQFPQPKYTDENKRLWKDLEGGGLRGNKAVVKFLENSKDKLCENGRIYFPLVYLSNPSETLKVINKYYKLKKIATQEVPFNYFNYGVFKWLMKLKENGQSEFYQRNGVWYFKEELLELKYVNSQQKF